MMYRKVFNNAETHAVGCLFLLNPVEYLGVRQNVLSGGWPCLLCTYISTCEIGFQKCRSLKPGNKLKIMASPGLQCGRMDPSEQLRMLAFEHFYFSMFQMI